MSLYGALFSGVSGLKSQSNKIGLISDNISNVNTIGYKGGQGVFQTLVTTATGTTTYSPGGVLAGNRQLISKQGLLQSTDSATDIAISGSGFFVVNQTADGTGNVLYTRAGSFTEDSLGNFRNTAGFFLQAWPLDREGRLPGEPGNVNTTSSANLTSLTTVNVQNLTGSAAATTSVSLSANLNAGQTAFPGASAVVDMNNQHAINFGIKANDIIIPGGNNGLVIDDSFTITSSGGVNSTFTYGGMTYSRAVATGLGADDGSGALGNGQFSMANDPFTSVGGGSPDVVVTHAAHGFSDGQVVTFTGVTTDVGDISAAAINNQSFVITVTGANTYRITTAETDAGAADAGGGGTVVEDSRPFTGQILDASTVTQTFLGTTGTSGFTTAALSFTITTASTGTSTFTYSASTPNAQLGQFNNMSNLVNAINLVDGLTARIDGTTGQLYISATNATEAITFANGSTIGSSGPPVLSGIDWIGEFGIDDIASAGAVLRFSTQEGLAALVNSVDGLNATVTNPLGTATTTINLADPLGTITFQDTNNDGSGLLTELGFFGNVVQTTQETLGPLGPSYDPQDSAKNMASGAITAQFSRQLQVFDALGASHSLTIAFLKLSTNLWAVEVFAVPASDVVDTDGLLAYGNVQFNGDGTLLSVDTNLAQKTIQWQNSGSDPTSISFNWGTAGPPGTGSTDGLGQFTSPYRVNFVNQNGAPVGDLTGVEIDVDGFITANYSNGQTQKLYKIPVADFPNPDQLSSLTGNVFAQSADSGEVNLSQPGLGGVGKIAAASLEASNVELAEQLTDMIVAQRAYQANTKVITTADSLLEELNRVLT